MSHPKVLLQSCCVRGLCFLKPAQKFSRPLQCESFNVGERLTFIFGVRISSPLCVAYFYSQLGHFIMDFQKDTHSGTQEIFPPLMGLRLTLLDVQTSVCAKPELLSSPCFPCAKLVIPFYYAVWFSSMNGFTRGSRERIQCARTLKSDSFD